MEINNMEKFYIITPIYHVNDPAFAEAAYFAIVATKAESAGESRISNV